MDLLNVFLNSKSNVSIDLVISLITINNLSYKF